VGNNINRLLVDHIDLWSSADVEKRSGRGRVSVNSSGAYGISKLKEVILCLAMTGKLSIQDSNEEPVLDLIARFTQQEKDGVGINHPSKKESLGIDNSPLPNGWGWVKFGDIAQHNSGKTLDKGRNQGILKSYITTSNLYWGRFDLSELREMPFQESELEKFSAEQGDLLICEGGDAGRAAVWMGEKPICFQNHIHRARFYGGINPFYIYRFFQKLSVTGEINQYRKGVGIASMSSKSLASIPIPLPPVAEQARIVYRVDQLMELCDKLDASCENAQNFHESMVLEALHPLVNTRDAGIDSPAWQRISSNFDELFSSAKSVTGLKNSILGLGVLGRLTRNNFDHMDESHLYDQLRLERSRLISLGLLKEKIQFIDFDGLNSLKGHIPHGWCWVRLGEIAEIVRGGSPRPAGDPRFYDGHIPFLKVGDVTRSTGKMVEGWTASIKEAGLHKTRLVKGRTVLLTNSGATLGIPAICDFETTFNDGIAAFINLSEFVFDEYLHMYLTHLSSWFLNIAAQGQGQPNLNIDIIRATWMPLPPIKTQHEIVSKVDEILEICSSLQARMSTAGELQRKIADALIEQALI